MSHFSRSARAMIPSRKDVSSLFVQKSSKWMSANTQTLNGREESAPTSPPKGTPNAAPAPAATIPETKPLLLTSNGSTFTTSFISTTNLTAR